jgi:hypothetical protein
MGHSYPGSSLVLCCGLARSGAILGLTLQARAVVSSFFGELIGSGGDKKLVTCGSFGPDTKAEAERSQLGNDAMIASDHKGYSGSGFVAGFGHGRVDTSIRFTITVPYDDDYIVRTCYANATGSVHELNVRVNDRQVSPITLPSLEQWNQWNEVEQHYPLRKGDNSIEYAKASDAPVGVNIDFIDVMSETAVARQQRWKVTGIVAMAAVLVATLVTLTLRFVQKAKRKRNSIPSLSP